MGTNDKKGRIQLKCLSSYYVGTRKFLKVVLSSMYGSFYLSHFGNTGRNEIMKRLVTSKIISKINEMHPVYNVLNKMTKIF